MLRTVGDQPSLWESLLPAEALVIPPELVRVDRLLDDERFFAPFREFFDARQGPSIPIETYLRLMFLKFRYRLGFETLCREVTDSIGWQRFCRIPLGGRVPHPTTLMKITTRCGQAAVDGLNEALLARAVEAKVLKTTRVRADTTVVEANVAYPSDSGLLAKGVAKMAAVAGKLRAMGLATRTTLVDKSRTAKAQAHAINANLRRRNDDKLAIVRRINGELAQLAERVARRADAVLRNARRKLATLGQHASGRARAAVEVLERTVELTRRVAAQTRLRLAGQTPDGASRVVSLHDSDARAIVKGRLGKPVEFGYKAQIVDNEDGVVVDHNVEVGNSSDADQLAPAIRRIKRRTGRPPRTVVADRGYGEGAVENELRDEGVRNPVLPRKGRPTAPRRQVEARRAFRQHVRWRTGSEGRISCLKRDFAFNRTRLDGIDGARTWCGHSVFTHNLVKISGLIE
jgi:transposase, IS5 family